MHVFLPATMFVWCWFGRWGLVPEHLLANGTCLPFLHLFLLCKSAALPFLSLVVKHRWHCRFANGKEKKKMDAAFLVYIVHSWCFMRFCSFSLVSFHCFILYCFTFIVQVDISIGMFIYIGTCGQNLHCLSGACTFVTVGYPSVNPFANKIRILCR